MDKKIAVKTLSAAVISHVFWGFSFIFSRTALDFADVFTVLSHRFMLAFIIMSAIIPIKRIKLDLRKKKLHLLILLGIAEPVLYFFGEQYGILHSNTIFSGVMIAMIPIFSTLAAAPILGEKPTRGQFFFSIISVCGVIGIGLLSKNSGSLDLFGVLFLLIAVISASAYTLLGRGISNEFSAFERTYAMLGIGAFVFTLIAAIRCKANPAEYIRPLGETNYLFSILFLGICCSVISYFLVSYAITHLSVAKTTVFANLTTAVSVFAGAFILKEPFSLLGFLFSLVILVGIYGVQKTAKD